MTYDRPLLLLTPSVGFGGGAERMAEAVRDAWPGRVERTDLYRAGRVPRTGGQAHVKLGFTARVLRAAAFHRPFTIVVLHRGLLPTAHAAAALTRCDVALVAVGIESWGPMTSVQKREVRRCSRLLAISTFSAQTLAQRAGVPVDAVRVVQLPVAPLFATRAQYGPSFAQWVDGRFLTVSRIVREHRYKGHMNVAEAMPAVLHEVPHARWVVVGDGDDLPGLRERCASLGVGHAVEVHGSVGDVELVAAYERGSFLALPSVADPEATPPTGEGFGLVYAEAASFGLPSIASEAGGGALDFVQHGVTGVTVPVADQVALSEAIIELLTDHDLTVRLGRAARDAVRQRHLPEHFARELRRALLEPFQTTR